MLSERDQRAFDEIERQMAAADPLFVASINRLAAGGPHRWERRGCDVTVVVAALSAVLCLVVAAPGAVLVAAALATAVGYYRLHRFPPRWRRGGPAGPAQGTAPER